MPSPHVSMSPRAPDIIDPFSSNALTYTTTGTDVFPSPSAYLNRRHSWVHIFPEGRVHQHPTKSLRYFKWGVSRLILECEPLPDIIPIFIDGNQEVMHESRTFPRFIPRAGKKIRIVFGEKVDAEKTFGDLRQRWHLLVKLQKEALIKKGEAADWELGELTDGLKYGSEAVALRREVTNRIRQEVLKVRRGLGYPDEDPKSGLVETWMEEGAPKEKGKMMDGSWIGKT
jgi:monolysocardiolipin acyltransferase